MATTRIARTVPTLPWSATGRWRARPSSMAVLLAGLWLFGTGEAMIVAARLGNTPWSVLGAGMARHLGLSIGVATIIVSALVLLGWIPLRERPGLGTVANAIVIGVALDVMDHPLPHPNALVARAILGVSGIVVIAAGGALYLSTHLGPGPRDGWMTGIARRFNRPIATVRLTIEAVVLVVGIALGGRFGVTTILFALAIGHCLAASLSVLQRVAARRFADAPAQ